MDSRRQQSVPSTKPTLKPTKVKLSFKKDDIRQCRLCLRVLPKAQTVESRTGSQMDLRRKVLDAVGVRITPMCKIQHVCANCLLVVDMIYCFRATCRQADTIHGGRLLMMHPGKWLGEENKRILEDCHKLLQRNRAEMQGLFKCSGLGAGDVRVLSEKTEVLLEVKSEVPATDGNDEVLKEVKKEKPQEVPEPMENSATLPEISDSDPEQTEICAQMLDAPAVTAHRTPRKNVKDHMCELCGKTMQKTFAETHHNKIHRSINPYKCPEPECKKRFPSKIYLNGHIKKIHSEEAEYFECSTCSKRIKGKVHFESHVKTHVAEVHPRKTACGVCGKYVYKRYLRDHMFVHTGELPYSCEFCDRKYAARTNWMVHRKKKHADQLQLLEDSLEVWNNVPPEKTNSTL